GACPRGRAACVALHGAAPGRDGASVSRWAERREELGRAGEGPDRGKIVTIEKKEGVMLAGQEIVGTIAVKDLAVARKFYEGTLGLKVQDDSGTEAHVYRSGDTRLIVYRSQYAGTNQATGLNLMVGADIDGIVRGL